MSQLSLKAQITEDMKAAMRAKETDRLGTIRLLQAAIKQREVDERIELDDAAVLAVIDKMLKQRKDSITAFEQAGRDDLVAKEAAEVAVLQVYMPAQLSEAEVDAAVRDAVAKAGATGPQDMGKVMAILKPALAGRADMTQVSARVKAALTGA
ncbi:GatB/YqeY domain-containing protein [Ralstonia pickettii]|uniref:GatB/YqeY domain-containing protein n=1 Tax=Ralstonia pickettii TaxID=329 RepID=A0A7X2LAD7_RALPI|nr:GatB/YqeY domain-containing protein [Ralstonia pickettii]